MLSTVVHSFSKQWSNCFWPQMLNTDTLSVRWTAGIWGANDSYRHNQHRLYYSIHQFLHIIWSRESHRCGNEGHNPLSCETNGGVLLLSMLKISMEWLHALCKCTSSSSSHAVRMCKAQWVHFLRRISLYKNYRSLWLKEMTKCADPFEFTLDMKEPIPTEAHRTACRW